jgi:hypothetical protein
MNTDKTTDKMTDPSYLYQHSRSTGVVIYGDLVHPPQLVKVIGCDLADAIWQLFLHHYSQLGRL